MSEARETAPARHGRLGRGGRTGSESDVAATGAHVPWRWQEGDLTVTRTAAWSAPGCHLGCGVKVYTDAEGHFVKLEGDEENPFNPGKAVRPLPFLPTGARKPAAPALPHEARPRGPRARQVGARHVGRGLRPLICEKFAEIKEEYGPWAILFASGTGRDIANGMYRMAYSYGSPNIAYQQTGVACYGPRITATSIMMGNYCVPDCSMYFADRYDNPQWKPPGVIFIWGNNPLVSNADGNVGHWMVDCMKRGSKIVVVDPRLTWIASKADLFLRLRPGTDAALALAIINVMIEQDAYDHEFVENWTYGFEDLAEVASRYPVDVAEKITWVPAREDPRGPRAWQ